MKRHSRVFRLAYIQTLIVFLGLVSLVFIGCGGGGGGGDNDDSEDQTPELNAIVVSPKAVLLTESGQTEQLISIVYNDAGSESNESLVWSSSDSEAVSVDENGLISSLTDVGSALITASSNGVVSNEVMVVIAKPVQGAMLVSDDQVVGDVEPEDPNDEWGLGMRFTARLIGISVPENGTILLGTGEKPLGGKVVSTVQDGDKIDVILELVTISEMFEELVIDEQIDMSSQVPTIAQILADYYNVEWYEDGTIEFTLKEPAASAYTPRVGVPLGTSVLNPEANYGPFKCEFGVSNPLILDSFPSSLTITNNLWVDWLYDSNQGGLQRCILKGDVTGVFKVSNTISSVLDGKVSCSTTLARLSYPFPGALGAIWTHVPLGLGFEIDGKITVAQFGFELQLDGKTDIEAGVQCPTGGGLGMDCDLIGSLDVDTNADFHWITPTLTDPLGMLAQIRIEPSLSAFAFANLEIGLPPPLSRFLSAEVAKSQFGVKQSGNFAIVEGQMDDESYSSDYQLSLAASVGAGATIQNFLNFMQINLLQTEIKVTDPLAASPTALSAVADTLAFKQGDKVTFTIDLDPQNIDYPIIGYNVSKVLIYRQTDDGNGGIGPADLLASTIPEENQTQFEVEWAADGDGTIDGTYFAFVETKAWPFAFFGTLEVAKIEPPPPAVNLEVKIGTISGYFYYKFYTSYHDPDVGNVIDSDVDWSEPSAGVPLTYTGPCEYEGGQSGGVQLDDAAAIEAAYGAGSISVQGGQNAATVSFSASAGATPPLAPVESEKEATGNADVQTDNNQLALIVENDTIGPVTMTIAWSGVPEASASGMSAGGTASFYARLWSLSDQMQIIDVGAYYATNDYGETSSHGQPSGSQTVTLAPGRHCFALSVQAYARANAKNYEDEFIDESMSSASISGTVSVSVR